MEIYYQELLKRIAVEFITTNHYSKLNANEKRIVNLLIEKGYLKYGSQYNGNELVASEDHIQIDRKLRSQQPKGEW